MQIHNIVHSIYIYKIIYGQNIINMKKLSLLLLPLCVTCFRFPKDWLKIRLSMLERERQQREAAANLNQLVGRGDFGDDSNIMFEDLDDPFRITTYRPTTSTTTTPAPPIVLEPWMAQMMETVNVSALELRFGRNQDVQQRFGMFGAQAPPPVFSASIAVWNFTMSMIKNRLYSPSTGNSLFSPVSILTAINILLLGTTGHTRLEVIRGLGYPRYTTQLHIEFKHILQSMSQDLGVTLVTSNAIFSAPRFDIRNSYRNQVRDYYGADIVPVDFLNRPSLAQKLMNRFVETKTEGLIKKMFASPVPTETKLIVSNTVYFNGSWEYQFLYDPPEFIGVPTNFTSFNKNISLTLMSSNMDFPYLRDDDIGLEIASLPYLHTSRGDGSDISEIHMFIILPTVAGEEAFTQLEARLPDLDFDELFTRMNATYADFELPKMKVEFHANLKESLETLGITRMFSGRPHHDFSMLTASWRNLKLDTLQHKAVLKITERGTEAAAVTYGFNFRSSFEIPKFTLDRPFFLFIYDSLNKIVVFWSRVVEPEPID